MRITIAHTQKTYRRSGPCPRLDGTVEHQSWAWPAITGNAADLSRHSGRYRNPDCRDAYSPNHTWRLGSGNPCRNDGHNLDATKLGSGVPFSASSVLLSCIYLIMFGVLLGGCTKNSDENQKKPQIHHPANEVDLPVNSPKRPYIKEEVLTLSQRPLMEPVAGKIAYDETKTTRITSPINGRVISQQLAELGAQVEKGAVLVEIDSPDLGQAQADYASALANLKLAEKAFHRSQELYEGRAVPLKDFEQSEDNLTVAKAAAERARLRLANLWIKGDQTNNRYVLRSPISGTIIQRNVNPGMEVNPSLNDPLYVVSDLRHLWVFMNVFEKDLGLIHIGQKVQVRVPAYIKQRFPATVSYIGQLVDQSTRTVQVRCIVDNPDTKLLPAMYATVDVQSKPDDKVLLIPLTAVFTEKDNDVVYVALPEENHYLKRIVKLGLRLKNQAVVESGLQPGERLVTEGALQLMAEEAQEEDESEQGKTDAVK